MNTRRMYFLLFIISILFIILIIRLSQIQLFSTESFGARNVNLLERSVSQRSHQILLSNGRGTITDRNGVELTNERMYDVILFPGFQPTEEEIKILQRILSIPSSVLQKASNLEEPVYVSDIYSFQLSEEQYGKIQDLTIQGFYPVERTKSEDPAIAQHFVGIVRNTDEKTEDFKDKQIGISGMEEAFEPFLRSKQEERLLYHVDASGAPMFGFELRYSGFDNSFYPLTIQTTIDATLQREVEHILDKHDLQEGGLILLDVETRDVLAMASRPNINVANPYEYNSIANRMLQSNYPGSVFKTVVALAALEHLNVDPSRTFDCSLDVQGKEKAERDLGMLNFEQSFIQSCNRTFAQLATELMEKDSNLLEEYAEKLGIIGPAGWEGDIFQYESFQQFPREEKGTVWGGEDIKEDRNLVRNSAIGQQNVRATPMAVANTMATIATLGKQKEVKGVMKIVYQNEAVMTEFKEKNKEQLLNPYSLSRLQQLLVQVTENEKGTGHFLNGLKIAGKSGTAQVGDESQQKHHYWFAGYFPHDQPKYALVVVDLNNDKGKTNIYPIYREIVEYIYESES